jgi:hypothetical protein
MYAVVSQRLVHRYGCVSFLIPNKLCDLRRREP